MNLRNMVLDEEQKWKDREVRRKLLEKANRFYGKEKLKLVKRGRFWVYG